MDITFITYTGTEHWTAHIQYAIEGMRVSVRRLSVSLSVNVDVNESGLRMSDGGKH